MATRVTLQKIKNILPVGTTLTDPQISEANITASLEVDDLESLADARLERIELYLSAHYAAVSENTLSLRSEKDPCSGGSVTYGFVFGPGVLGTPFGQTANSLSGGQLAELDKRPAGMFSIGTH